jgi:hypothetical protein
MYLLWVIFTHFCGSRALNQDPDPGLDFLVNLVPDPDRFFGHRTFNRLTVFKKYLEVKNFFQVSKEKAIQSLNFLIFFVDYVAFLDPDSAWIQIRITEFNKLW